jgi:rod shape-determining protein MreC
MLFLKKYFTVIVVFILLLSSLVLLSYNIKPSGTPGLFKKLVFEVAAPLEGVINACVKGIGGVWDRYIFLVNLQEENRELKKKITALTSEVNYYRETYLENERLKKILNLEESAVFPTLAARVVSNEGSSLLRTIMINKGTRDGVKEGLPVIANEGVVGKIVESSWNYSRVLLVTDYNSNIDALVQGSRAQGILQGAGHGLARLKYVQRTDEVKEGDPIITSGLGGIFPKGLLLGTVFKVDKKDPGLFQKIEVSAVVDVSRIEEVLVILTDREDK